MDIACTCMRYRWEITFFPTGDDAFWRAHNYTHDVPLHVERVECSHCLGGYYYAEALDVWNHGATEDEAIANLVRLINNSIAFAHRDAPVVPPGHMSPFATVQGEECEDTAGGAG